MTLEDTSPLYLPISCHQ